MTGYYMDLIPNYAEIATTLTELSKKRSGNVVKWTDELERTFVKLKIKMLEKPDLKTPDFTKKFVLRTDAADIGLSGVLLQNKPGKVTSGSVCHSKA